MTNGPDTIDLGVLGSAGSPTHAYTGLCVLAFEPIIGAKTEMRVFADQSVDRVPAPVVLSWKIKFDLVDMPDTTDGVAVLEKILYWQANTPQYLRGSTAEWIKRHGDTTTWVPVVALGEIPATRDVNHYNYEITVRECATLATIAAP